MSSTTEKGISVLDDVPFTKATMFPMSEKNWRELWRVDREFALLLFMGWKRAELISPGSFHASEEDSGAVIGKQFIDFAWAVSLTSVGSEALRLLGWPRTELRWLGQNGLFFEVVLEVIKSIVSSSASIANDLESVPDAKTPDSQTSEFVLDFAAEMEELGYKVELTLDADWEGGLRLLITNLCDAWMENTNK